MKPTSRYVAETARRKPVPPSAEAGKNFTV
jgi:hypothetical protein